MTDRLSEKVFRYIDRNGSCRIKDVIMALDESQTRIYARIRTLKKEGWVVSEKNLLSRSPDRGNLFIIVGPVASGKTTLTEYLRTKMRVVTSFTSRAPREGEVDGYDYYFVSRQHFEKMIADDTLVEHVNYNGNYYGIGRGVVDTCLSGSDAVVVTDAKGAKMLKQNFPCCFVVFLYPPLEREEHIARMRERGDSEDIINQRMALVSQEIIDGVAVSDLMVWPDEPESVANLILGVRETLHHG